MKTTEEPTTSEDVMKGELVALAGQIREWQETRGLSNNKLLEKFPGLGSTKTFVRISGGELGEYNVEKHLTSYRATWAAMQEPEGEQEIRLQKLSTVQQVILAVLEARQAGGNQRFVLVEGDTGCGKSTALQCVADRYPETVIIEASKAWGDRPMAFLTELAMALGGGHARASQADRLREVVNLLNQRRRIVCIDEGHEFGPSCLNVLRTLINQTQRTACVFVLAAMKTLWKRLEYGAYEEARQLTGNRLQKRVKLHRVSEQDVKILLNELGGIHGPDATKAVTLIGNYAEKNGHLKFAACVALRAKKLADGDEVTMEHITTAVTHEVERR